MVHKKLLCESADFFNGAFANDFEEARKGEIYMPEDSPGAFSLYIDWLYRSHIPLGHTDEYVYNLYYLYLFAEKLCLSTLKDKTMDRIQDVALEYKLSDILFTPELVKKVFNGVLGYEGLPKFCTFAMIYIFALRSNLDEDGCIENFQDDDLSLLLEMSKENTDIFLRFHKQLNLYIGESMSDILEKEKLDPRTRDEADSSDRCFFHCHAEDLNCRAAQSAEEKPAFRFIKNKGKNSSGK